MCRVAVQPAGLLSAGVCKLLEERPDIVIDDTAPDVVLVITGQTPHPLSEARAAFPQAVLVALLTLPIAPVELLRWFHEFHLTAASTIELEASTLALVITIAAAGQTTLPRELLDHLAHQPTLANGVPALPTPGATPLTPRETSVMRLLRQGHSNKEIARTLVCTEPTVKVHVKAILRKLRLRNRTQAAMWGEREITLTPVDILG